MFLTHRMPSVRFSPSTATSAKINISYSILFNLTTSYSSYFRGKKGISRNKTSFFLLMQMTHHCHCCCCVVVVVVVSLSLCRHFLCRCCVAVVIVAVVVVVSPGEHRTDMLGHR